MALDRQKILNELGSVVNQLQSANCGCMDYVFEQKAQNGQYVSHSTPVYGGHQHNCCHGANFTPAFTCAKPQIVSNPSQGHCMGSCNAPKLYSDTYNYLNNNLMQPVVKEVYDDLKSITPDNTIVNNALATQIGFPNLGNPALSNQQDRSGQNYKHTPTHAGQISKTPESISHYNTMAGMGPNVMNMMTRNEKDSLLNGGLNTTAGTPNAMLAQPITNNTIQQNNQMPNFPQITKNNTYPNDIKMTVPAQSYGQHAQGMGKFKEMFPGVVGQGNLGFDPMAIAIQMNPANRQQKAISNMHKLMNVNTNNSSISHQSNMQNTPSKYTSSMPWGDTIPSSNQINQNQNDQLPKNVQNDMTPVCQYNPQIYSAEPVHDQTAKDQQNQLGKLPKDLIPNFGTTVPLYAATVNGVLKNQPATYLTNPDSNNQFLNGPINPQETCQSFIPAQNLKPSEYNTLGQPIEMLPAKIFHSPEPTLPQTLSPQPTSLQSNYPTNYSNVKSTISKTLLTGSKPFGKTPSRSHLQRMYNEYKGSQSYTHQNINSSDAVTRSDGKLYQPVDYKSHGMPIIERTVGDTALNETNETKVKVEDTRKIGYPSDKQQTEKVNLVDGRRSRNGLQDMVYTSYSTSSAWSFHG